MAERHVRIRHYEYQGYVDDFGNEQVDSIEVNETMIESKAKELARKYLKEKRRIHVEYVEWVNPEEFVK
jgi:hypothetical protein